MFFQFQNARFNQKVQAISEFIVKRKNSKIVNKYLMKIHNLRYADIKKSLESKEMMLDLDLNSNNQLFRTQKIFSAKFSSVNQKFDCKQRILSGVSAQPKDKEHSGSKALRPRPTACNSSRKSQSKALEAQQSQLRPRTATNRFWKEMQVKVKRQDIFLQLSKEIKRYFATIITDEEKSQTLEELKLLLNILHKQKDPKLIFLHLQKMESQMSRFLKHRICHLYFYLIYYKFYMCFSNEPLQKEFKILTLAEYHARTFYFRKVALLICIQIQQKLVKMNNYDDSRRYAIKSLKLAVLNNDRYQEVKMLEYIGILKYYEGVLNANGANILTKQQRINILKIYNEQDQIPKIFQFLEKDPQKQKKTEENKENGSFENEAILSFEKDRMQFNQGQNFVKNNVPTTNLKRFNRNFHAIGKKLLKTNIVKQSIKKTNTVGEVKKFIGRQNYIKLYPQGYTIKSKFQSQVFVTHKKYGQIERGKIFVDKELPSIIANLETLISTEIFLGKVDFQKQ